MSLKFTYIWFLKLRWFAFICQMAILLATLFIFNLSLPWEELCLLLLLIPITQIVATRILYNQMREEWLVGGLLCFDTFLLTFVLALAGGPTNPFTIIYLLHVVLSAVLLSSAWTWSVTIFSCIGFSLLFVYSRPVPEWLHHEGHDGMALHLYGMLFAYAAAALLTAYFLSRIVGDLRSKERKLERLENVAKSQKRLATLATITGSVAHELGTPLSTMAVVARELEYSLQITIPDSEMLQDVALLKAEIGRCKRVLHTLSEKTGDILGESAQSFTVSELLRDALEPLEGYSAPQISGETQLTVQRGPRRALGVALRAIIKNALEASSGGNTPVRIGISESDGFAKVVISDSGEGMSQEIVERLGEPFFSTKGSENGMGLGVYLAKLIVEQLGGDLSYLSQSGRGTRALIHFPLDCAALGVAA